MCWGIANFFTFFRMTPEQGGFRGLIKISFCSLWTEKFQFWRLYSHGNSALFRCDLSNSVPFLDTTHQPTILGRMTLLISQIVLKICFHGSSRQIHQGFNPWVFIVKLSFK